MNTHLNKLKKIDFLYTFRFRIVAWYVSITCLLVILMVVGINSVMTISKKTVTPPFNYDSASWNAKMEEQREVYIKDLRLYSTIGAVWVIVVGSVGIYVLSKELLKPIDQVAMLASRISNTNLAERIAYQGPNDEIKRMADTFDDMLSRLEESFKQQQEFSQNASHELRTPIAIALTNIEVLEMLENPSIDDYKELVSTIKVSLERMNGINNNLQLLTEGNKPNIIRDPFDINIVLKELIKEMHNAAIQKSITIKSSIPDTPMIINGDVMSIRQCFFNLIDNAIKYNNENGTISIRSYIANSCAVIDISDTGIGIPAEQINHIFERFYRVDKSRSRKQGGSGLGLSIVEKIITNHGGEITVESIENEGSTFHVILPLAIDVNQSDIIIQ